MPITLRNSAGSGRLARRIPCTLLCSLLFASGGAAVFPDHADGQLRHRKDPHCFEENLHVNGIGPVDGGQIRCVYVVWRNVRSGEREDQLETLSKLSTIGRVPCHIKTGERLHTVRLSGTVGPISLARGAPLDAPVSAVIESSADPDDGRLPRCLRVAVQGVIQHQTLYSTVSFELFAIPPAEWQRLMPVRSAFEEYERDRTR